MESESSKTEKPILLNTPEAIRFRRNSSTLVILGTGVIVFGFWGIIKLIAMFAFDMQVFHPEDLEQFDEFGRLILNVVVFVVMAIDVILRLIVGLKAIREGRGKKTGIGYLIVTIWLISGSAYSIYALMLDLMNMKGAFFDNYVSVFMELSSLVISLEVFIAAISVRRYRSKHVVGGAE